MSCHWRSLQYHIFITLQYPFASHTEQVDIGLLIKTFIRRFAFWSDQQLSWLRFLNFLDWDSSLYTTVVSFEILIYSPFMIMLPLQLLLHSCDSVINSLLTENASKTWLTTLSKQLTVCPRHFETGAESVLLVNFINRWQLYPFMCVWRKSYLIYWFTQMKILTVKDFFWPYANWIQVLWQNGFLKT